MNSKISDRSETRNETGNRMPTRRSSTGYAVEGLELRGSDSGVENGIDGGLLSPNKPANEFPLEETRRNSFDVEVVDSIIPKVPTPDVNVYQQKKTLAQGMMDLALLSANANQLRYVLESGRNHPYYYANLSLISISLILQIAVGVGLILNSRYNVKKHEDMCKANSFNNLTVVGIFVVTIVNVFISAFGIGGLEVEP